eukprot:395124-Pelagomonas_calceolata.AAC.2
MQVAGLILDETCDMRQGVDWWAPFSTWHVTPWGLRVRRRQQEEEKIRRIAEMEEAQLAAEDKYMNRQEEAEQKTKKLKKLWKKYQEVRAFAHSRDSLCWSLISELRSA